MNGAAIPLGKIAGIRIRAHTSWLVALFLLTASLSVEFGSSTGRAAPAVAFVTALALFASVVAHELGHSLVARARGVGVSSITLFIFGGIARLESEPRRARDTIAIAIAGPLVSVAIGVAAFGLAGSGVLPATVGEPLAWLGRVNLGLAVFNLLPGLPLDGGQVLQGVLWAWRGDRDRATLGAARAGRAIGWTFIVLGGARAVLGSVFDGLWVGFIGWFLLSTARSYAESVRTRAAVAGASISDAMVARFPSVAATTSLDDYVRGIVASNGRRAHVVLRDGGIAGVVTLERVLQVPRHAWAATAVGDVARGVDAMPVLDARTTLFDALTSIGDAPFAFVTDGTSILGVVDRDHLAAVVGVRVELAASAALPAQGRGASRQTAAWT